MYSIKTFNLLIVYSALYIMLQNFGNLWQPEWQWEEVHRGDIY